MFVYFTFVLLRINLYFFKEISNLRLSLNGSSLPNAREIQLQLFLNKQINISDKNNQFLMQWGQFVAQDVSSLAIDSIGEGKL